MYGTASTAKQDYVRELGVTPIDYQTEDFVERIMAETDGSGVDVVFDAVGVDNFKRSYTVLAPGGILGTYGLYKASLGEDSRLGVAWPFVKMLWQMKLWEWFPEERQVFHLLFHPVTARWSSRVGSRTTWQRCSTWRWKATSTRKSGSGYLWSAPPTPSA